MAALYSKSQSINEHCHADLGSQPSLGAEDLYQNGRPLRMDKLPWICLSGIEKSHLPTAAQKSHLLGRCLCFQTWASIICNSSCVLPKIIPCHQVAGSQNQAAQLTSSSLCSSPRESLCADTSHSCHEEPGALIGF